MAFPLAASACPALQLRTSVEYAVDSYLSASPPNHFLVTPDELTQGVYSGMKHGMAAAAVNMYLKCLEQVGSFGSGAYAVLAGLDWGGAAGLVVTVNAGLALIDCPVESKVSRTIALPDNQATVWIWLTRSNTLAYTTTVTPPSTPSIPIMVCTTSAGAVTAHDTCGVPFLRGGHLVRTSGDVGAPTDTPDAKLRLYTETLWFTYLWDGSGHVRLPGHGARTSVSLAGGSVVLSKAQVRSGLIELTGLLTGNVTVEFPKVDGATWAVYNNTTGAFTVTLKNNGAAGVAITQTKKATYYSNGTDMVLLTAEV